MTLIICEKDRKPLAGLARTSRASLCALAVLITVTGNETASSQPTAAPPPATTAAAPAVTGNGSTNSSKSLVLQEGDTIKISFPAAPNLDTVEIIRRDGMITLGTIGEYQAAGKTPATMESDLKKLYGTQLLNSDVSVTVQSSAFVIYVMGAVGRPGKIVSDRPLSVLEALIEAGIDDSRSNLKAIKIIRIDDAGHTEKTKLNLYKVIHSKTGQMPSFTLKPYDVIDVPERFSFF